LQRKEWIQAPRRNRLTQLASKENPSSGSWVRRFLDVKLNIDFLILNKIRARLKNVLNPR